MAANVNDNLAALLRTLLGSLLGLFLSGAAMTAIGQPTATHTLSSSGNTFWHILLGLHLAFLLVLAVSNVLLLAKAFTSDTSIKSRTVAGTIFVIFGIVSGNLVLHKVHQGLFVFCMTVAFLLIGFAYGPIARSRNIRMH